MQVRWYQRSQCALVHMYARCRQCASADYVKHTGGFVQCERNANAPINTGAFQTTASLARPTKDESISLDESVSKARR